MRFNRLLRFFRGKNGTVVIWQVPNLPLIGWAVCKIISIVLGDSTTAAVFSHIATLLLFIWSYFEIKDGANAFRKVLGIVIMVMIIRNVFSAS